MTIQLELNEATLARLQQAADQQGVTMEEVVKRLIESAYHSPSQRDPQEILRAWEEYADSRDKNVPILSDYAMSRESMYDYEGMDR